MIPRPLGRSGLSVAPLALGGNVFGWTIDEPTSFAILDAFVDAGYNLIDTADVYSRWKPGNRGGESEAIIGRWMGQGGGRRGKVLIATKVGMEVDSGSGLGAGHIARAVEDSLRRLGTDHIDLYQSHKDDPGTPLEETLGAYSELIRAGKVRAIGASNYTADRLAESLKIGESLGLPIYTCLQPEYNLVARASFEAELGPLCVEKGVGVIPYYALASGFLTGKYRSEADLGKSARGQKVAGYLDERGHRILRALDDVSARLETTPARVAIAWLRDRPGVTAPIASATNLGQLGDLIAAAELVLDAEAVKILDAA